MRVYVDSSALIKRAVQEAESDAVESTIEQCVAAGAAIVSSSLAWVEVSRAIRARFDDESHDDGEIGEAIEAALSGVAERFISEDIVSLARRLSPARLRSLDAIHLATAIVLDVDEMVVYDDRLISACHRNGVTTKTPL